MTIDDGALRRNTAATADREPSLGAGAEGFNAKEAGRFLELLGKDRPTAWLRFIDPLKKRKSGADHQGVNSTAALAVIRSKDAARFNVYVVIGNADTIAGCSVKDTDITSVPTLFVEWDDGADIEAQAKRWHELGLPEPSVMVATGGKSVHCYWVLEQPMAPEPWKVLTKRLIAHCKSDAQCSNPSRVMRLPGSTYYSKTTGEPTGQCRIIGGCEARYDAGDIEACLPSPARQKPVTAAPKGEWAPRGIDEINAAAEYIPRRIGGEGTYEQDRNALCGCAAALAEAGVTDPDAAALALLGHLWPTEADARQVLASAKTRKAASFWAIAAEHGYGMKRSRKTAKTVKATPANGADPTRAEVERRSFRELLADALAAIRRRDEDTEMEARAEIMGRFKRSDAQITAALFRLLTEQETGRAAGDTPHADALDLDAVEGMDALVDGFMPANDLGLAYGAKGSGKTAAALALSFAVLDGTGFLDHSRATEPGAVLFIASDSGAAPLKAEMQRMGLADHPAVRGDEQRFYVWAYSAAQRTTAWCASINGCVELLQFVKAKGVRLVVIDSAKTICAKAGISYLDNDSIAALLTFMKETICAHASVLILSHDGTEKGSHSGAKAWAEVPSIVHNIQQIPDAPQERLWRVVKNRMGQLRELRYQLGEDGRLEPVAGVEVIGDAGAAVLKVLTEAHKRGVESVSSKELVAEIGRRFRLAPKTVANTLWRMVGASKPEICRVNSKRGHYKLAPRLLADPLKGVQVFGKEEGQTPVIESDLTSSRLLPEGRTREEREVVPESSHFPGAGKTSNPSDCNGSGEVSSRDIEMPIGGTWLVELPSPALIGSGADVFGDGDDPHWGQRAA